MKRLNFRATLFSVFGGVLLALAIIFSFGYAQQTSANDGNGWCDPPPRCANFGCLNGKCKFIAQENGAVCPSGGSCVLE